MTMGCLISRFASNLIFSNLVTSLWEKSRNNTLIMRHLFFGKDSTTYSILFTVAINDLLCMKNVGAQIAMDFS